MAAHLIVLFLFSVLKGVHSITTVSKVSVEAGKSISIPCLYESKYIDHVKYLCEGHIWSSCSYAVKTNKPDPSGKYSISDDKKEQIFTVTIKNLTYQNTDYWCVVEINNGPDCGQYFQLSVTSGTPSLYVAHQRITGYIGESITIRCHHSNSGEIKWCRLGRNCVTGSSGSIDGAAVTTHMRDPNVFTVTMSGLKSENSGWYWCAEGDIQIPVYLNVTEKPINSLNPLSEIITGYGYRLRSGAVVSHLLYMDDIKLYAKSEQDINSLIPTTRIFMEGQALHGTYHWQIKKVGDIQKSYQWLDKAGLKDSTEALIMAA
ncbi:polymeric immunoglobulin receptor-like [Pelmatolapia mariae]|uniref:polymeric immunoglobulin receptor-like n=1 Tax=Pelmatolapia mariae TaxID=158779 RepID=UPI003211DCA5